MSPAANRRPRITTTAAENDKTDRMGARLDDAVKWLKRFGVTHLRTGLSWADRFREDALGWFDRQMETLQDFNITVTLCFTPEHLGLAPHYAGAPIDPNQFADFCAEMIERYAPARRQAAVA